MTLVQKLSDDVYEIPKPVRTGVLIAIAALRVTVMWIHSVRRVGVRPFVGGRSLGRCDWAAELRRLPAQYRKSTSLLHSFFVLRSQ